MLNGQTSQLYIGMMSGTSLDGVDAVLVDLSALAQGQRNLRVLAKITWAFRRTQATRPDFASAWRE